MLLPFVVPGHLWRCWWHGWPSYQSRVPGSAVESYALGPLWLSRWQLHLFPETAWLGLVVQLISRCDPRLSWAEAKQMRAELQPRLAALRSEPGKPTLLPALPFTLWCRSISPQTGHLFLIPPPPNSEPPGLVVFLHGHGGNSLLYADWWQSFATQYNCAVVCPSFGYGNWEHPAATECVKQALAFCEATLPEWNKQRTILCGLSQGGAGVGRVGRALPECFSGLVFLSPTMEPQVLTSEAFRSRWANRPVLVHHGLADKHVSVESVQRGVAALENSGASVTTHWHEGQSHFLFFQQKEALQANLARWIQEQEPMPNC